MINLSFCQEKYCLHSYMLTNDAYHLLTQDRTSQTEQTPKHATIVSLPPVPPLIKPQNMSCKTVPCMSSLERNAGPTTKHYIQTTWHQR
uniref:Uncharacterized protein n=1 Tax=Arion vulgaris TaxID=1028688 RepID=A0A0B7BPJ9_9EUPU